MNKEKRRPTVSRGQDNLSSPELIKLNAMVFDCDRDPAHIVLFIKLFIY